MLRRYGSPVNIGSKETDYFFSVAESAFHIEEKIDGSQFSFGVEIIDGEPTLLCRSHHNDIDLANPGMFAKAVATAQQLFKNGLLSPHYTYYGEFLNSPHHNKLTYSRVPEKNIILFDICDEAGFVPLDTRERIAKKLGLETTPILGILDHRPTMDGLEVLLGVESILGGTCIEGVVLKGYVLDRWGNDLMLKYVSAGFRELSTKVTKPKENDLNSLIEDLNPQARYDKAVQHLTEAGILTGTSKDIGPLIKELNSDLDGDKDYIMELLWNMFRKSIQKGVTSGFATWYLQDRFN
jgi:hypothetical protein